MIKNFGIDMIISNYRQMITDTTMLVNPAWRKLDKQLRRLNAMLERREAKFGYPSEVGQSCLSGIS